MSVFAWLSRLYKCTNLLSLFSPRRDLEDLEDLVQVPRELVVTSQHPTTLLPNTNRTRVGHLLVEVLLTTANLASGTQARTGSWAVLTGLLMELVNSKVIF